MRLDKLLANNGAGSRKEVKKLIKNGRVKVDGHVESDPGAIVDENVVCVELDGNAIFFKSRRYYILNKPPGVISATEDASERTVVDLIDVPFRLFPVGRLDKDTTGLLILTDDGEFSHRLLSPKKHVEKEYEAYVLNPITKDDIKLFKEGIVLDDGYKCMPATLDSVSEDGRLVRVVICEGKYHQVKRMFDARDNKVLKLKRIRMGDLWLDDSLSEGEYRELTDEEYDLLGK